MFLWIAGYGHLNSVKQFLHGEPKIAFVILKYFLKYHKNILLLLVKDCNSGYSDGDVRSDILL